MTPGRREHRPPHALHDEGIEGKGEKVDNKTITVSLAEQGIYAELDAHASANYVA